MPPRSSPPRSHRQGALPPTSSTSPPSMTASTRSTPRTDGKSGRLRFLGTNETHGHQWLRTDLTPGWHHCHPGHRSYRRPQWDPLRHRHEPGSSRKNGTGAYHQRLHALDLATGAERSGSPSEITASYPGTGDNSSNGNVIFDPRPVCRACRAPAAQRHHLHRLDLALRQAPLHRLGYGLQRIHPAADPGPQPHPQRQRRRGVDGRRRPCCRYFRQHLPAGRQRLVP